MNRIKAGCLLLSLAALLSGRPDSSRHPRVTRLFDAGWLFFRGEDSSAWAPSCHDRGWQSVTLPHDWSIAGPFSRDNATTAQEGALPAGVGWYRKHFRLPASWQGKNVYIDFGGIYRDSKVWINGHLLGERPDGHISFRYRLNPWVHFGNQENVIAVRVDNSLQPDSRWYTGSGIYRDVWLTATGPVAVAQWGTFVTTPEVNGSRAVVRVQTILLHTAAASTAPAAVSVETILYDASGRKVGSVATRGISLKDSLTTLSQQLQVDSPRLWSVDKPALYKAVTLVVSGGNILDRYETPFGIRRFHFDTAKGFFLNGSHLQIHGVCLHEDLGGLGMAVSAPAILRRLKMLKSMGCNAIRTAHNPPSQMLLHLCDSTGFLVMDEAFDCWKKRKVKYDYHIFWNKWHRKDLEDQVRRDRNHPSVFMWSIGNEIREQFDSSGIPIARELAGIVKKLDTTRPVTSALTEMDPAKNFIFQSGALDVIGINYNHRLYKKLPALFGPRKFIATETMSALSSRGDYDMPSDSIRRWPVKGEKIFTGGNSDYSVSAYDNVSAYWGSTAEETLKAIARCPYIAGQFVWSGYDYLGEPTPYGWPARSSYFGIMDLAGFPKDVYYLYKSVWTDQPVLHVFPPWNGKKGQTIDVWAYYNQADEVELYLNGKSLGVRRKKGNDMHVMWRVKYEPGTLKAVSRKDGKPVLERTMRTAGRPAAIRLVTGTHILRSGGRDVAFVKAKIVDSAGNLVPDADNRIRFIVKGHGALAATNNGYEADTSSFTSPVKKAYNGLCLAVLRSGRGRGRIVLTAVSPGLASASVTIRTTK